MRPLDKWSGGVEVFAEDDVQSGRVRIAEAALDLLEVESDELPKWLLVRIVGPAPKPKPRVLRTDQVGGVAGETALKIAPKVLRKMGVPKTALEWPAEVRRASLGSRLKYDAGARVDLLMALLFIAGLGFTVADKVAKLAHDKIQWLPITAAAIPLIYTVAKLLAGRSISGRDAE